jgi:hypothetical protein
MGEVRSLEIKGIAFLAWPVGVTDDGSIAAMVITQVRR